MKRDDKESSNILQLEPRKSYISNLAEEVEQPQGFNAELGLNGFNRKLLEVVAEGRNYGLTPHEIVRRVKELGKESGDSTPLDGWTVENPSLWNFDDVLRDRPEIALLQDQNGKNFLEMGDVIAIIGKSKTKKSFISLQLALCVSAGIPLWDKFTPTKPNNVLVVQSEVKAGYYNERLVRMSDGLGIDRQDIGQHFSLVNARGFTGGLEQFTDRLISHGKGKSLIVIDPLYTLIQEDENKANAYTPVWNAFREITEQTGAAIAYVHHDAKGISGDRELQDRGAGHSSISRFFDTGIFIDRHKDDDRDNPLSVLDFLCRNRQEPESFSLQFDTAQLLFVPSELSAEKRTSKNAKSGRRKLLKTMLDGMVEHIHQHALEHPLGNYLGMTELREWITRTYGATQGEQRAVVDEMAREDPRLEYIKAGNRRYFIPTKTEKEPKSGN